MVNGVLLVVVKIDLAELPWEAKHLIILDHGQDVTRLIVTDYHRKPVESWIPSLFHHSLLCKKLSVFSPFSTQVIWVSSAETRRLLCSNGSIFHEVFRLLSRYLQRSYSRFSPFLGLVFSYRCCKVVFDDIPTVSYAWSSSETQGQTVRSGKRGPFLKTFFALFFPGIRKS